MRMRHKTCVHQKPKEKLITYQVTRFGREIL